MNDYIHSKMIIYTQKSLKALAVRLGFQLKGLFCKISPSCVFHVLCIFVFPDLSADLSQSGNIMKNCWGIFHYLLSVTRKWRHHDQRRYWGIKWWQYYWWTSRDTWRCRHFPPLRWRPQSLDFALQLLKSNQIKISSSISFAEQTCHWHSRSGKLYHSDNSDILKCHDSCIIRSSTEKRQNL